MWKEAFDSFADKTVGGWLTADIAPYKGYSDDLFPWWTPGADTKVHWHNGAGNGGRSLAMHRSDGFGVVLTYNQAMPEGVDPNGVVMLDYLWPTFQGKEILDIASLVDFSPTEDLFEDLGYARFYDQTQATPKVSTLGVLNQISK